MRPVERLLLTAPTLLGVLVVAFLLLNVAPGDPVTAMVGDIIPPQRRGRANSKALSIIRPRPVTS